MAHLWNIGLRGCAYDLFSHYLLSRFFVVVAANGVLSSQCPIHSGVPQGGIWSPLLFDLYIWELPRFIHHSSILCYADDITLFQRIPRICCVQCAAGLNADSKGLWSAHIDYVVAQSRKRVGALRRICDYLSPADLCTAYKVFVRLQLKYDHLLYWGAAESHLA